jgi:hypothetical protein
MLRNFMHIIWLLSRFMQLDLPHMMEFIYWIFIQIRPRHAMWTSKLLFSLPFVFRLFTYHFLPGHIVFVKSIWLQAIYNRFLICFPLIREETRGLEENQPVENKLVPLSQRVLSCAAHPLNHTIIAGTQVGFLFSMVKCSYIIWFRKCQDSE